MKTLGIEDIIKLILYGLNVNQVNKDLNNFYNSFGPYKLLDNNKLPLLLKTISYEILIPKMAVNESR